MPKTSTDLIDLRVTRFASALRVALGVSLGLHLALAVGVKMFWHGKSSTRTKEEMPITVEFSTEIASENAGASAAALQSSAKEEPAPPREPVREAPKEVAKLNTPVEAPPVVPAASAATPAAEAKPMPALAEGGTTAASPNIVSGPANLAMNGRPKPTSPAPHGMDVSKGKPGILAQPLYRKNPEPGYPAAARRRRQEGVTLLAVRVTATGHAARVEVKQSSGFKLLDDAASLAVLSWEFDPARIGTVAMESEIEVPIRFRLKD